MIAQNGYTNVLYLLQLAQYLSASIVAPDTAEGAVNQRCAQRVVTLFKAAAEQQHKSNKYSRDAIKLHDTDHVTKVQDELTRLAQAIGVDTFTSTDLTESLDQFASDCEQLAHQAEPLQHLLAQPAEALANLSPYPVHARDLEAAHEEQRAAQRQRIDTGEAAAGGRSLTAAAAGGGLIHAWGVVTDSGVSVSPFSQLPAQGEAEFITEADLAENEQQFNRCFGCTAAAAGPRLTNPLIQRTHSYGATSGAEGVERAD